jgi:hypothetical protein
MNYFKKMAFILALVAGLCGGAWAQNWGHGGANHARDNHSWNRSAPEHGRASVPSGNWGYRNNSNYQYRNGHWGWGPNRTWGGHYPNGNYGYYPNGNYGYYPYGNYGYYPYGGYYPYPTTGGYYPGGYGNYGYGGYGAGNGQYQIGYNDGLVHGRADRQMGRRYQPAHYDNYQHNNQVYRAGFANGYNAGYGGGW